MFLPQIAIGAVFAAILGGLAVRLPILGAEYYTVVMMLGITAAVAGMMRLPLTAVVFTVEVLSGWGHLLPIVVAVATTTLIVKVSHLPSVTDGVLEHFATETTENSVGT